MELLTINQSAKFMGVHPNTIRNWIVAGTLAAYRIGRGIRIDKKDLEDILTPYGGGK
jgi:excisionase family DNA binding protein